MFGFDFLFLGGLLALPLAATPILLHLLSRRKSPVVLFSTTRFIKSSMQKTAARRHVQKWLLLAARCLLLLILILAAAQPARKLAASLGGSGVGAAAIVIDTSYSMQTTRDGQTLLDRANAAATDLLQKELAGAEVALFTSEAGSKTETLRPAADVSANWRPLVAGPSPQPLADRIRAAEQLLDAQQAGRKMLIVVTDMQQREFPHALEAWPGGTVAVVDLHDAATRSAGVQSIAIDPPQPLPGVGVEAAVKIVGRPGESRGVSVAVNAIDGKPLASVAPRVVTLDDAGAAELRIPIKLPAEPLVAVRAQLDGQDDLPWDDSRQCLVQTPAPRQVRVLGDRTQPATRFVTLALDPTEGQSADWPLRVKTGALDGTDNAVVAVMQGWPSRDQTAQLRQALDRGNTLVLIWRPGLQATWAALPDSQKQAIRPLLPGDPVIDPSADRTRHAAVAPDGQQLLGDLLDPRFQIGSITTRRLLPLERDAEAKVLLSATAADGPSRPLALHHTLGNNAGGSIYTLTTWPDQQFSGLGTHPLFLPMLVRFCLPDATTSTVQNIDVGTPLRLSDAKESRLTLTTPTGATYAIDRPAGQSQFAYTATRDAGVYLWKTNNGAIAGAADVEPPAEEGVMAYRDVAAVLPGENVVAATSLDDLRTKLAAVAHPQPSWSPLIAAVLMLLCVEAVVGNWTARR